MAALTQSHDNISLPSQQVLAIAFAVVKSKPAGQTIKEYLINLRRNIQHGKRPDQDDTNDRHIDSSGFWKDAFHRVEKEQAELRDKIFELERRNDALRAQIHRHHTPDPMTPPSSLQRKRNRDGESTQAGKRPSKQLKSRQQREGQDTNLAIEPMREKISGSQYLARGQELITMNHGTAVLRHFYDMTRLQQRRKLDGPALCTTTVALLLAMEAFITSLTEHSSGQSSPATVVRNGHGRIVKQTLAERKINPTEDIETAFRCLGRMFPSIIRALDKVAQAPDQQHMNGQILHALIRLFGFILGHIHVVSFAQAEEIQRRRKNKARRKTQSAEQASQKGSGLMSSSQDDIQEQMCRVWIMLVSILDAINPVHAELLEGLAFILLDRVGKQLHAVAFEGEDHTHESDLRGRSTRVNPPNSRTKARARIVPKPRSTKAENKTKARAEIEQLAQQKEACYLVDILKHTLPLLFAKPDQTDTSASFKEVLSVTARRRLQSTLINAVFGGSDEAFRDRFRLPPRPSAPAISNVSCGVTGDEGHEWFKQEIWSLVGWDILCEFDTVH